MPTHSRDQQLFPPPASAPSKFSPSVSESVSPLPQHAIRETIGNNSLSTWVCLQKGDPKIFALWLGVIIMINFGFVARCTPFLGKPFRHGQVKKFLDLATALEALGCRNGTGEYFLSVQSSWTQRTPVDTP